MLCCWVEDPNSEAFKLHIPRIQDYLWLAEDGMKMQVVILISTFFVSSSFFLVGAFATCGREFKMGKSHHTSCSLQKFAI